MYEKIGSKKGKLMSIKDNIYIYIYIRQKQLIDEQKRE
jgi:hypothetical protein